MGGKQQDVVTDIIAGEKIVSFRQCMKRYAHFELFSVNTVQVNTTLAATNTRVINPKNTKSGSIHNFALSNFAGWKGSFRMRFVPISRSVITYSTGNGTFFNSNSLSSARAGRITDPSYGSFVATYTDVDQSFGWDGMQIAPRVSGEVLSIELPYYDTKRFRSVDDDTLGVIHQVIWAAHPSYLGLSFMQDDVYISIGDDFNTFFFLGVQPIWTT